jgi:hypothetical protein
MSRCRHVAVDGNGFISTGYEIENEIITPAQDLESEDTYSTPSGREELRRCGLCIAIRSRIRTAKSPAIRRQAWTLVGDELDESGPATFASSSWRLSWTTVTWPGTVLCCRVHGIKNTQNFFRRKDDEADFAGDCTCRFSTMLYVDTPPKIPIPPSHYNTPVSSAMSFRQIHRFHCCRCMQAHTKSMHPSLVTMLQNILPSHPYTSDALSAKPCWLLCSDLPIPLLC